MMKRNPGACFRFVGHGDLVYPTEGDGNNVRGKDMKTTIPMIIVGVLVCSCTERRSSDTELREEPCVETGDLALTKLQEAEMQSFDTEFRSDPCLATWTVIDEKLEETASTFTAEFGHLQRTSPNDADVRADLLFYASEHFPGGGLHFLKPLWRKGCEDPHPSVRLMAMKCVTRHLELHSTRILTDIAEQSRLYVRDDIQQYLQRGSGATKD
jgi:hypothetical protein